jgi:hypothetical protein
METSLHVCMCVCTCVCMHKIMAMEKGCHKPVCMYMYICIHIYSYIDIFIHKSCIHRHITRSPRPTAYLTSNLKAKKTYTCAAYFHTYIHRTSRTYIKTCPPSRPESLNLSSRRQESLNLSPRRQESLNLSPRRSWRPGDRRSSIFLIVLATRMVG